uniref:Uncharacterized protein n=1 Tax=Timema genevievae TaxID=629358 RepID=A0A7R9PKT1_TIMGE|nr:unnamed protein product [Timema genevievae]
MEGQDVCTRKAKPEKPLAITSIFNTLFPLDEVDSKRVIVGMSVKYNFTPYVQLEKCGGNGAVFNRTNWQELGNYMSIISKFFSNTHPPQNISLTNHEISLRRMCGDRMVIISEKQDAGLKRVAYLAPRWARLCEVWDLIDVAVDRRNMWSTPISRYCNDLIDTLVVDVCDTLTESADAIDLEQPMVETHIRNLDLISATYYRGQVIGLDYYMLDCELKTILLTHLRDTVEKPHHHQPSHYQPTQLGGNWSGPVLSVLVLALTNLLSSVPDLVSAAVQPNLHQEPEPFMNHFGREPHVFGGGSSYFGSHFGHRGHAYDSKAHAHQFSRSSGGQSCRTVTQQIGNIVTTYTQCS